MKSIKDRDFYICHKKIANDTVFIGLWDNPSIADRDVKLVIKTQSSLDKNHIVESKTHDKTIYYIASTNVCYELIKVKIYDAKMQTR